MKIKVGVWELVWMAAGAAIFAAITFLILHFQTGISPSEQIDFKSIRAGLAGRMMLSLTASSEAEKSAVLAVTDEDSIKFAQQSRTALSQLERERKELEKYITGGGTRAEKDLFVQFSTEFMELKKIDSEILTLAVKNSNIKAYNLAYGPAAEAMASMSASLDKLAEKNTQAPAIERRAYAAQIAALRIQALLAPHIAEENAAKMDEMENIMAKLDKTARGELAALSSDSKCKSDTDLQNAIKQYGIFSGLRSRILALSRENTNVRSLSMSLGQKRKILSVCTDALTALQQEIQNEPIQGINETPSENPRKL